MRRTRFQQGSLQVVDRAGCKKAREDRWYELQADKEDRNNRWVLAAFGVIALGKPHCHPLQRPKWPFHRAAA